ncbi:hypothetical protein JKP88DRAFT_310988 [Tribonema minus]|uniref:Carrier domain-containing protein n=1 Tax=Tribonema minus TaxID=303371 RepID=A0A835Z282_9STRA|nr:hypothetical protein JKP88DRAFT_310988 [Tribonema minus]
MWPTCLNACALCQVLHRSTDPALLRAAAVIGGALAKDVINAQEIALLDGIADTESRRAAGEVALHDSAAQTDSRREVALLDSAAQTDSRREVALLDSAAQTDSRREVALLDSAAQTDSRREVALLDSVAPTDSRREVALLDSAAQTDSRREVALLDSAAQTDSRQERRGERRLESIERAGFVLQASAEGSGDGSSAPVSDTSSSAAADHGSAPHGAAAAAAAAARMTDPDILREAGLVLGVGSAPPVDSPLRELGLDSMQGVQLLGQLETRFALSLPDEALADPDTTLRDIVRALAGADTTLRNIVRAIRAGGQPVANRYVAFDCARVAAALAREAALGQSVGSSGGGGSSSGGGGAAAAAGRICTGSFHTGLLPHGCLKCDTSQRAQQRRQQRASLSAALISAAYSSPSAFIALVTIGAAVVMRIATSVASAAPLAAVVLLPLLLLLQLLRAPWRALARQTPRSAAAAALLRRYGFRIAAPLTTVDAAAAAAAAAAPAPTAAAPAATVATITGPYIMVGFGHDSLSQALAALALPPLLGLRVVAPPPLPAAVARNRACAAAAVRSAAAMGASMGLELPCAEADAAARVIVAAVLRAGLDVLPVAALGSGGARALVLGKPLGLPKQLAASGSPADVDTAAAYAARELVTAARALAETHRAAYHGTRD